MRLQKYMADCGVASRRKSEEIILEGRVRVNGSEVSTPGYKVEAGDVVEVDGKAIRPEEAKVYIALNKPVGYITSAKDQFGRQTVLDLVSDLDERIYPVGRLDYDTSGLIILTNDGEFTYRMTHPRYEIKKVYMAKVEGVPSEAKLKQFREGLLIEDYKTSRARVKIVKQYKDAAYLEIEIHEGRNRQVRKMCEKIGHPVKSLKRISVGSVRLGKLEEGKWRYLTESELEKLERML